MQVSSFNSEESKVPRVAVRVWQLGPLARGGLTAVEILKSVLERTTRLQVSLQGSLSALLCEPQQFPSGKGPAKSGFGDGNVGRTRQPHSRTLAAHPPQLGGIIQPLAAGLFEQLPGIVNHKNKHQTG